MLNFEFSTPTRIVFGRNTHAEVGKEIRSRNFHKVLIHYGGTFLKENGVLDAVHKSLEKEGIEYIDFGGVVPNPRLKKAQEGVALCKEENIDFILAIGGGSVIDSSKTIAYGLANDFDLEDLFLGKVSTTKIAPIGCISTIAATGSETSNSTVIDIETESNGILKRSYNHDCARPLFAIMNPELTFTLPTYQTCSGAADIMMHTMERYFTNTPDVDLIDKMSEGLLVTVRDSVLKVIKEPKNYEVRANLMWAGSLSHNGLTGTGRMPDFATHKLGQELSAMFEATHGASLTAVWSSWAKYVYKTNIERFAQFAINVFAVEHNLYRLEETALKGIEQWDDWCRKIGMPTSLTELGIDPTKEQIKEMAKKAAATGNGTIGGFQRLDEQDIINIYTAAR
ncbi:iron-containing alcohol dehydrogenase [Gottschalkiaceae bacterium SANA]|nr:iron-containing alcohol dehydrogenase [Gottschalkiaceae bacterium SANA]